MSLNLSSLLNPEQAKAASQIEGAALIIAGAGSGKTRMITYRIANMLENGIKESEILALTFTNKAAKEMAERIEEIEGKKLKKLTATTFHSFGLGILKQYIQHLGYRNDFTLYDDNDNLSLVKNCIINAGYSLQDYNANTIKAYFSSYKTGRMKKPEEASAIRRIYEEWLLTQKAYNVVDFDDLILLPIVIFEQYPKILETIQNRYKYIMVDEFQDTSMLQYKLISLIAKKYRNIAVVGDDDQSIYSWRGANYENIIQFEKDFPERIEYRLEHNYRSSNIILSAANAVIIHNSERKDKKLWTDVNGGDNITIKSHKTPDSESFWIYNEIKTLMREYKYGFNDFAILVRTNSLLSPIETSLMEQRIPVRVSGGSSFFDRREIRDFICYLKVLINENDDNSLLRIINTPRRSIGRTTVEKLRDYANKNNTTLYNALSALTDSPDLNQKTKEGMKSLLKSIYKWKEMVNKPENLVSTILRDTNYATMINEEFPNSIKAVAYRLKGIEILGMSIKRYFSNNEGKSLRDYLNTVSIIGNEDEEDSGNKVNLMTMHASKGLEFKVVFLAGIEDNIIPSKRALEENIKNIDEERRLFYVAITRAKKHLYVSYAETRQDFEGKLKKTLPSRFIEEIPSNLFKNNDISPEEAKRISIEKGKAFLEMLQKNINKK